jgi:sulfite reductase (NADPH) flavoprotein alpha-component
VPFFSHHRKYIQKLLALAIGTEGNLSREEAVEYLANLQKQKRYQRDVY